MTSGQLSTNTELALERTRLAYERTLMAWVRTATSLISFGFAIFKFFQFLHQSEGKPVEGAVGVRGFALLMISIGLAALLLATFEHRRNLQALRATYHTMPYSLAAVVSALIGVLGVVGLFSVLLRL